MVSTSAVAWQYTPGWGSLFTVAVAALALISSLVISVITLRRNARNVEQSRIDAKTDRLKAELIDLINALGERQPRGDVARHRINEAIAEKALNQDAGAVYIEQTAKAILAEQLWDVNRRIITHALGTLMLTEDVAVVRPIGQILAAIAEARKIWDEVVDLATSPEADAEAMRRQGERIDETVNAANKELVRYCLLNLGVNEATAVADFLDALDFAAHNTLPVQRPSAL